MNQPLKGKTALITGASRGIGRAVALAFARAGADLVLTSRTQAGLDKISNEAAALGGEVRSQLCDLSVRKDIYSLGAQYGDEKIDILVNNAGLLGPRGPMVDLEDEDWDQVLAVNLTAVFLLTREILRIGMAKRKKGCVINVASGVGRKGRAGWGIYGVSKFGLEGLTQALADEYKDQGIRFYSLNPGPTRSDMRAEAFPREDPKTLKTPEAVAEAFVTLARDDCKFPTGAVLDLNRETGKLIL